MNVYLLVFALLAGLGVYLILRAVPRRARTAEEILGRTTPSPAPLSSGQAGGDSVRAVITSLARNRATGILTVTDGAETCSICLLFGHMFHASCGLLKGEEAVVWALRRPGALCRFDATAQLPTEETITQSTESLLETS